MNNDYTSALKTAGARVEAMLERPMTRQEQLIASLVYKYGWDDGRASKCDESVARERAKNVPYLVTELRKP